MRSRTRNLLINLSLATGSIALVIALLEIGLRLAGIDQGHVVPPPIYQRSINPDISYELKPNLNLRVFRSIVQTNSTGFRSPEIDPAKPSLAILGDSIAFGYGVENTESIPGRLQAMLPHWNVINAAVPGYNLLQEAATYIDKVRKYQPKALVLVFYWNDLHDMVPADLSADGNLYARGQVPPPGGCSPATTGILSIIPGKCWLDAHSAVYRTLKKFAGARAIKQNQAQELGNERKNPYGETFSEQELQTYAKQLDAFVATLPPGLPRLFVIWPEAPLHFTLRPQLRSLAETRGFNVLDLYDVFGNAPPTLGWDTVHPNAQTDAQAAEVIKAVLEHEKMLQP